MLHLAAANDNLYVLMWLIRIGGNKNAVSKVRLRENRSRVVCVLYP